MLEMVLCILGFFIMILTSVCTQSGSLTHLTLNLLSWSTFFMATISWLSMSRAWYTTPNEPFPITLMSVYETSWGRSGPCPGVATTVVTFPLSPKHTTKQVFFFCLFSTKGPKDQNAQKNRDLNNRSPFSHVWPEWMRSPIKHHFSDKITNRTFDNFPLRSLFNSCLSVSSPLKFKIC